MGIIDLSGQQLLYGVFAMVWIVATHGLFVALFARLLGERGPAYDGHLTLNPLTHGDPIGVLALIVTPFGWIRLPRLDPKETRGGVLGILAVILLSLAATLALAAVLFALRPLIYSMLSGNIMGLTLIGLAETAARKSVTFALFNLLPVLPLTAGLIWAGLAPALYEAMARHVRWIGIALAVLILTGVPTMLLGGPASVVQGWLSP